MNTLRTIHWAAEYGRQYSKHKYYKHGAAIVNKNEHVWGVNKPEKTHPRSRKPYKNICAEFDAIFSANTKGYAWFRGATLYVARYGRDDRLRNSRPCDWCGKLVSKMGIRKVYYSVLDGYETL